MSPKPNPAGEAVIESGRAYLKVNGLTRVPGRLILTKQRLLFARTNALDKFVRGEEPKPVVQVELDNVVDIVCTQDDITVVTRTGRQLRFNVEGVKWKPVLEATLREFRSVVRTKPSDPLDVALS